MAGLRNQLSYSVVNEMVFSGLAHMINNFRRDVLQLPALRVADRGAAMLETQQASPQSACSLQSIAGQLYCLPACRCGSLQELLDVQSPVSRPVWAGIAARLAQSMASMHAAAGSHMPAATNAHCMARQWLVLPD